MSWQALALGVLLLACLVGLGLRSPHLVPRNALPHHLLHHPVYVQRDLISPDVGAALVQLVRDIGSRDGFPTNAVDTAFYHTEHEHVGEARAMGTDGKCDHPYLIPSQV